MAKDKLKAEMVQRENEWETREDVDRLLRADEVCQDPKRYKRAVGRLESTVKRLHRGGRSKGRSSSR